MRRAGIGALHRIAEIGAGDARHQAADRIAEGRARLAIGLGGVERGEGQRRLVGKHVAVAAGVDRSEGAGVPHGRVAAVEAAESVTPGRGSEIDHPARIVWIGEHKSIRKDGSGIVVRHDVIDEFAADGELDGITGSEGQEMSIRGHREIATGTDTYGVAGKHLNAACVGRARKRDVAVNSGVEAPNRRKQQGVGAH